MASTVKKYVVEFTHEEMQKRGLLICRCGHPDNNHFRLRKGPCAHCKCEKYDEIVRYGGKLIEVRDE